MPRLQLPAHASCLNPRTTRSSSSWRPSCSRKETVFLYVLSVKLICVLFCLLWFCSLLPYVLLCCWGVVPVLTLYSPRSIVWELFFSPHFPHVNAVFNSTCISLLIILVWLCMWQIIKNLNLWCLLQIYLTCILKATLASAPSDALHKSCSFANGYVHAV